jgi:hypothetical protein
VAKASQAKKPTVPTAGTPAAAAPTLHEWSKDALSAKAQLYADEMFTHGRDEWQFGFWSALTLEVLGRAALANISPTLLADPKDWHNHYYALGHKPNASRFVPKSIVVTSVFSLLSDILPSFNSSLANFAAGHLAKRNEELHSSTSPFADIASSSWLPAYYEACDILLASIGFTLDSFFGVDEAKAARTMIAAAKDESAKAVAKAIQAHKKKWDAQSETDREIAASQASVWATKHSGHRVPCPSCGSTAIVSGLPVSAPTTALKDEVIVETQYYLPSKFECIACGLKISGLSQLHAAGVGDTFKSTRLFEPAEYYAPHDEYDGYEDDNNER